MSALVFALVMLVAVALISVLAWIVVSWDNERQFRKPAPNLTPDFVAPMNAPTWTPERDFTMPVQDERYGLQGEYLWNESQYTR